MKKVLLLLIAFILYINYENYLKPDMQKLHRQEISLKTNIARERDVQDHNYTKESLLLNYDNITFSAKKYAYSKAMGIMQNHIYAAAKGGCSVTSVKWAQVPNTKDWYDKLKMDIRLTCKPDQLLEFTNKLKMRELIYVVENFRVSKDRKKPLLHITAQLIGFRTHEAK